MSQTKGTVGIAGAGILGRLIACYCLEDGWNVTIFDEGAESPCPMAGITAAGAAAQKCGSGGCPSPSYVAAGMLAPYCEMRYDEPIVPRLGRESLDMWSDIIKKVGGDVFSQRAGSLVVVHQQDKNEFLRLKHMVETFTKEPVMEHVKGAALRELEPEIDPRITEGLYFPLEGQVDSRGMMAALGSHLRKSGAELNFNTKVTSIEPNKITTLFGSFDFDWALDCRGMGAKADLKGLRGVRGEIIIVHAPDVNLNRPVRLMHPRYPLYIVPRPNHDYVVGATSIESEDLSEISVRGALELLSALYSLHTGFSEARIIETATQLRPALMDNSPKIFHGKGLCRINGLYRHGYLISPKIARLVASYLSEGKAESGYEALFETAGK